MQPVWFSRDASHSFSPSSHTSQNKNSLSLSITCLQRYSLRQAWFLAFTSCVCLLWVSVGCGLVMVWSSGRIFGSFSLQFCHTWTGTIVHLQWYPLSSSSHTAMQHLFFPSGFVFVVVFCLWPVKICVWCSSSFPVHNSLSCHALYPELSLCHLSWLKIIVSQFGNLFTVGHVNLSRCVLTYIHGENAGRHSLWPHVRFHALLLDVRINQQNEGNRLCGSSVVILTVSHLSQAAASCKCGLV